MIKMNNLFPRLNKKGESETAGRNILIALVLFLLLFTAIIGFVYSSVDEYGTNVTSKYDELFKKINSTYSDVDQVSRDLQTRTTETSKFTAIDNIVTTGGALIEAIKLFFKEIPIISYMVNVVGSEFGIPPILLSLLMIAMVITLVLIVASWIRGLKF